MNPERDGGVIPGKMRAAWLLLCAALIGPVPAVAQTELPVVRARSRVVTIVDGRHVKTNYWFVMPERAPDVYYVEIPRQPHRVTFTTDRGSIAFDVTYGSTHRFVVRLEDGAEALTEIRAQYRPAPPMDRVSGEPAGPMSLPFTVGDNDKIYVQGALNGGPPLSLQVDLGAGGTLIKKASVSKAGLTFDGTITLRNSDGVNNVPSSSRNVLTIHGARWRDVPVAVADNMTSREDGIVGNTLFQDKVVEIDYGRRLLTIHDERPALSPGWTREDVVLDGGTVPFVRGRLSVAGTARDGWFMLDTGAYTSILHADRLSRVTKIGNELRRLLGPLGGSPAGPEIRVAGRTFADTNYSVRPYDGDASALGLLGNDLLKRFDLVLDNRQGAVYFRPNGHMTEGWRNPDRLVVRVAAAVIAAGGIAAAWLVFRRRRCTA